MKQIQFGLLRKHGAKFNCCGNRVPTYSGYGYWVIYQQFRDKLVQNDISIIPLDNFKCNEL